MTSAGLAWPRLDCGCGVMPLRSTSLRCAGLCRVPGAVTKPCSALKRRVFRGETPRRRQRPGLPQAEDVQLPGCRTGGRTRVH